MKHLTVSAEVVTARNATKSGLLIIGIGLAAVAFVAYKAALPFVDRIRWALTTEHDILHYFLGGNCLRSGLAVLSPDVVD